MDYITCTSSPSYQEGDLLNCTFSDFVTSGSNVAGTVQGIPRKYAWVNLAQVAIQRHVTRMHYLAQDSKLFADFIAH